MMSLPPEIMPPIQPFISRSPLLKAGLSVTSNVCAVFCRVRICAFTESKLPELLACLLLRMSPQSTVQSVNTAPGRVIDLSTTLLQTLMQA